MTVNRYFSDHDPDFTDQDLSAHTPSIPKISSEAKQLLVEATQDRHGILIIFRTLGGLSVITNNNRFGEIGDPRSEALWEGAVKELDDNDLVKDEGYKGEVFRVTTDGYRMADKFSE